jgi:large subunit ribosomal protein L22
MEQVAKLNFLRIAPRKVRLIASLVKGLSVAEAEAQLMLHRQRASKPLLKLLRSAVANAKNNAKMDTSKLVIAEFQVDGGPMLKRFLPRARGMASPIQKKMSHVTLTLREKGDLKASRFTVIIKKKAKNADGTNKKKDHKHEEESVSSDKPKQSGFFKRNFNRKAV